jgi:cytokinin dehydrogenase
MTPDRRTLLRAGLGATATLASPLGSLTTRAGGVAPETPPPVEGGVSCDADTCAAASEDFGRIIRAQPQMVVRPKSSADVGKSVQWAVERKLKVAARGCGHSTYGRALAEGGVVIDMTDINAIGDVKPDRVTVGVGARGPEIADPALASDRIKVGAGAPWSDVLDAALKHGMTPPVLTNHLGLSVGGTLAIGGIGGSSSHHGLQADNVLELQVVTADGGELTCSRSLNADLFDAARAGLGQCGIITRATLRLVRAPERVRRWQLYYPNLAALAADQQRALGDRRFDQLQGAVLPDGGGGWRYMLDGAIFYDRGAPDTDTSLKGLSDIRSAAQTIDVSYRDDAHAFAKFEALLRSKGHWTNPQPWLFTFLPASRAEQFARETIGNLTGDDIGPFGRVTFYPLRRDAIRAPLIRMPDETTVFAFNIVRIPASNDAKQVEQMLTRNRAIYTRVRDAGGVLYPVSAFPMWPDDWQRHFGASWTRLREAKQRYDPHDLLTPGYNVFGA